MNREIKLRIWDKEIHPPQMIYVEDNKPFKITLGGSVVYNEIYVNSCVLMLYTGLKDKNNREIYEGDIVENEFGKKVIKWIEGTFIADEERTLMKIPLFMSPLDLDKCEVIGNIYENAELLK
jgi:uncharacterized phage protein (TIGR01671 family)